MGRACLQTNRGGSSYECSGRRVQDNGKERCGDRRIAKAAGKFAKLQGVRGDQGKDEGRRRSKAQGAGGANKKRGRRQTETTRRRRLPEDRGGISHECSRCGAQSGGERRGDCKITKTVRGSSKLPGLRRYSAEDPS